MNIQEIMNQVTEMAVAYAPKILMAILTLIIGFQIIKWLNKKIVKTMEARDMEPSLQKFLSSFISVILKVLVLFSVAAMFGIKTTAFIAIFSALAFAVGLALQGNLAHFASGVLILMFKPYKVGDLVELSGHTGVVEEIQVFTTEIITPENKKVIIPNGTVTSNPIVNISGQGELRVDMKFGVSYGSDIDKTRTIIKSVLSDYPLILKDKEPDIFIGELADSAVNFVVRPWCKSEHYWDVYFHVHENIKKELDKNSIEIPFPQMDVHMANN
jgi:small conductance mechanosensitive channel